MEPGNDDRSGETSTPGFYSELFEMPAVCEPIDSNSVRSDLRSDFPILDQQINGHPLIYFDNAASSQKPRAVVEAIQRYYEREHANMHTPGCS